MQIKQIINNHDKKIADNFAHNEWKLFNKKLAYGWNTKKYTFVILEDKRIVGYSNIKINGGAAYLSQIIVSKEMRGKGMGDLLLKKFEAIAKNKKCHIAYLETSEKHKEALKFYKNHGYKTIAKLKNNKFHLTWYFLGKEII